MFGQGRPSLAIALARAVLILCAFVCRDSFAQTPAPAEPLQLRITWGDGEACKWTGRIMIDDGALSKLKRLGTNPDATASTWIENGQVRVATLSPRKRYSIEVAAQAGPNAKLLVELAPPEKGQAPRLEIALADLPRHPYQVRIDGHGNVLAVQVVPQSGLNIVPTREDLIFAPGEQCSFDLSTSLANLQPGTALSIQTSLTGARNKDVLWTENQRLPVPVDGHPKVHLTMPLPREEGVYTVHVAAARPSGFERFWSASTRLAERSFQVVVLSPNPPASSESGRWESVLEIDPTNPRWFDRLPNWTQFARIPGMNHGALGSTRASIVDLPLGRFVELPPMSSAAAAQWQAYSLPLQAIGVPHMLEVDYNAETEQSLGISIVEPNAGGVVSGTNRDSGVYVEGLGRSEAKDKRTFREVFWPRTQAPMLLITNLHRAGAAARFSHIRVFKRSTAKLSPGVTTNASHGRLVAAYLAGATLAETFGATQALDLSLVITGMQPECVNDCETAYESATRLADYLHYAGYNSAVIKVPIDRAAGLAQHAQTDSPQVDPLELVLRVFDREGILVLPAVELSSPIEELEELRRTTDPRVTGLEWIGADERTWLEANGTRDGCAPYYNLLEPRVQEAVLSKIQQFVKRYSQHRAFAGVAIRLSSRGYAQLPPLEWGVDDATIARFSRDTQCSIPDTSPERFARRASLLTAQYAETWRSWRAGQVSAFYSRVAACVRGNTDRRLLLTTEDAFSDPQLAARLRPNLLREVTADGITSVLRDVGVDREMLEHVPGLVLCPTRYVESKSPLPDSAIHSQISTAVSHWKSMSPASPPRAAMLYHAPFHERLTSFELASKPWRMSGEMRLASQQLSDVSSVCQPYVDVLANNDPTIIVDGGEQLSLGQEDIFAEVRSTIAQLPATAERSEIVKQPIVARMYAETGQSTLLVLNRSPWRCDLRVSLDLPQGTTLTPVNSNSTDSPTALAAGRQTWSVSLGPYGVRAVRVPAAGVKILDVDAGLTESASAELASALADLNRRDLTAPHLYQALANPSFEPFPGRAVVNGWHIKPENAAIVADLSAANPQEGKTCLHVRSDSPSAAVESDLFRLPSTGQLAMTAYVRGQHLSPETKLRLRFIVEGNGDDFQRIATVSAAGMQHPNGDWGQPFAMMVNDLPLQSNGQMRIAFELTGPGEVWLDNVKLYDLLFPLNFYASAGAECIALTQQIHAAKAAYDAKQISDCVNLLDSYWPSFIIANRPLVQSAIADSQRKTGNSASPPKADESQESPAGISDRLKRLLPIRR